MQTEGRDTGRNCVLLACNSRIALLAPLGEATRDGNCGQNSHARRVWHLRPWRQAALCGTARHSARLTPPLPMLPTRMMQDRTALIAAARAMSARGLAQGTSGNLSCRTAQGILITPSAIPYEQLTPEMLPLIKLDGEYGAYEGDYRPSSEWRFHLDIYLARPQTGAVVHHHAPYCTALSMARREIPACHYMIARFGGAPVHCAPYALFGTAALSAHVLRALEERTACLMANHGAIATGRTIEAALSAAAELETLAQQYLLSLAAGGPVLLTDAQVAAALTQFSEVYGPNIKKI